MSTPHYGTPLASFFATVSGQRILYAVSALTFIGLSLGAPPLAAASALVVAIGRLDRALGVELRVLDRTTDALSACSSRPRAARCATTSTPSAGQGAVIQLTPEAMDLFQAGVEDRPGVRYQCVRVAPPPSPGILSRSCRPVARGLLGLFTTFYGITARADARYPCAAPVPDATARRCSTAPSGGRRAFARTTASCRCGRSSGGASSGRATRTTSTCSATSRVTVTRRPFWASSGGGRGKDRTVPPLEVVVEAAAARGGVAARPPPTRVTSTGSEAGPASTSDVSPR